MSALAVELKALIRAEGPLPVDRFMALALGHPRHGYYMTRDPLGAGGDFVTAPEISQVFGELIGVWAAAAWEALGRPASVNLVELGPGRGTLMADALRAAALVPGFLDALDVHLVETSPILRAKQAASLAASPRPVTWHGNVLGVPDGPVIAIANEFFDALPVRQLVRHSGRWHERVVGLDGTGALAFGLAPDPEPGFHDPAPEGAVIEIQASGVPLMRALAERIARAGGAALAIDYGHTTSGHADTLQAVRRHAFADPLAEPGEADVTAHVDFAQLARAAREAGARVFGPITQGAFLAGLGLEARARRLAAATPARAAEIAAAANRLAGTGEGGMGELFKAMAVTHPALESCAGF